MKTLKERFFEKVNKTETCWLWIASTNSKGYGHIWDGKRITGAHRVSWLLHYGEYPKNSLLHVCDNPRCVNPAHLIEGTQLDNMHDMIAKGRRGYTGLPGIRNPKAKLNIALVREIKEQLNAGIPRYIVARDYGMSWGAIDDIYQGKHWKEVAIS